MNDTIDLWAFDGSFEIKAIDDEGRFEGLAVPFGEPDLSKNKDRFDAKTDFGRAMKSGADLLYHHGLPTVGPTEPNPLADSILGDAEFKTVDAGIWMTGQMKLRDEYEAKVWAMVKSKKLGLSTGIASHRVRREKNADGTHSIKTWPIAEVSLTPAPANPRTAVYAIKTLLDPDIEAKGLYLGEHAERAAAGSAIDQLASMARYRISDAMANEKFTAAEKTAACKGCLDEFTATSMRLIAAMMTNPDPETNAEIKSILASFGKSPSSPTEAPESVGFVQSLARAESALEWAIGKELNGTKSDSLKSLMEAMKRFRDSRVDPVKLQASIAKTNELLARFKG
jgi:hypothetical protein